MEWTDLVPNDDLDLSVKLVNRVTALQIRLDSKLVEKLRWKEKRVKVQVSLAPGRKRVRLVPAQSGWEIADKKTKGAEVSVRQLAAAGKCSRKCAASIESDALIISLPDDFELKNPNMVLSARAVA